MLFLLHTGHVADRYDRRKVAAICKSLLAMIALAGCATGPKITADYDRSANFTAYRSFGFYQPLGTDQAGYESLVTQTLKAAVDKVTPEQVNAAIKKHLQDDNMYLVIITKDAAAKALLSRMK